MAKKITPLDRFAKLTLNNLEDWAGDKIVSRGVALQAGGAVSDLTLSNDGSILAWVKGSRRYAVRVEVDEDDQVDSYCTYPYELSCKHGVAVVLEYQLLAKRSAVIPPTEPDDDRLKRLSKRFAFDLPDDDCEETEDLEVEIDAYLTGKSKTQLIEIIKDLSQKQPNVAREIADRRQLKSGSPKELVKRLRREIRELGDQADWQNDWEYEGGTPDFSKTRRKLEDLLQAGYADDVLALGSDLLDVGLLLAEESDDEGETVVEVADCMRVIATALEQSSLNELGRLEWAVDAVLKDCYNLCEALAEYLHAAHPASVWSSLVNRLLVRLRGMKTSPNPDNFTRNWDREHLSNWIIHGLERSGREDEIIPLCEVEARKTFSYERLIDRLIGAQRYVEAEHWIKEGIQIYKGKFSGPDHSLRRKLLEIRTLQKNWAAVAAMQVDEFVRYPYIRNLEDIQKTCGKLKKWPIIREFLMGYLEKGALPWLQKDWPLSETGLEKPAGDKKSEFPMLRELIDVAIWEKKPDQVIRWYDQLPKSRLGWGVTNGHDIAEAIKDYAPDRAVIIWKRIAEGFIAQVKPSAYIEAANYLRKAGTVLVRQGNQDRWHNYLRDLRQIHRQKRKLMEVLDKLEQEKGLSG